ncbi:MAG: four helix bundle protein [Selenomonadaceae bacterium]|nr:four helix bundle protein [Selenomonadaceae bacterium]
MIVALNRCEDLIVWQKAMDLTVEIYRLVKFLPREETYALSDQMRRAFVSIPSNIAEGHGRNSNKEFANFLSVARGSLAELKTQLQICHRLKYLSESESEFALNLCNETYKLLNAFISKLRPKI